MFFIAVIVCVLTLVGYFFFFKSPAQSVCSNNCNNVKENATVETATAAENANSQTVSTATDEHVSATQSSSNSSSKEVTTVAGATSDATNSLTIAFKPTPDLEDSTPIPTVAQVTVSHSQAVITSNDSFSAAEVKVASDDVGNSPSVEACQIESEETVAAVEHTAVQLTSAADESEPAVQDGAIDTDILLKSCEIQSKATTVATAAKEDAIESAVTAYIQQEPPSVVITQAPDVTQEDLEAVFEAQEVKNTEPIPTQSEPDLLQSDDSSSNIHSESDQVEQVDVSHHTEPEIQIPLAEQIPTQAEPEPIFPTEVELMQTKEPEAAVDEIQSTGTCQLENLDDSPDDLPSTESVSTAQPEAESSPSKSLKNVQFTLDESSADRLNSNDVSNVTNDITSQDENVLSHDTSPDVINHNVVTQNGVTQSAPVLINSSSTEYVDDSDDLCVTPQNDVIQNGECWHQSCDSIDEIVETDTFDIDLGCRSKPKLKRQETLYECAEVVTFVSRYAQPPSVSPSFRVCEAHYRVLLRYIYDNPSIFLSSLLCIYL